MRPSRVGWGRAFGEPVGRRRPMGRLVWGFVVAASHPRHRSRRDPGGRCRHSGRIRPARSAGTARSPMPPGRRIGLSRRSTSSARMVRTLGPSSPRRTTHSTVPPSRRTDGRSPTSRRPARWRRSPSTAPERDVLTRSSPDRAEPAIACSTGRRTAPRSPYSPDTLAIDGTGPLNALDILSIADGTVARVKVASIEQVLDAAWAPDGRRIAILGNGGNTVNDRARSRLFTVRADGTDLRLLTVIQGQDFDLRGHLSWSPDSKRIAYSGPAGGRWSGVRHLRDLSRRPGIDGPDPLRRR